MEVTMPLKHQLLPTVTTDFVLDTSPLRKAFEDFLLSRNAMLCIKATFDYFGFTVGKFLSWLERRNMAEPQSIPSAFSREGLAVGTAHEYYAILPS
jgi:hypothetical protein